MSTSDTACHDSARWRTASVGRSQSLRFAGCAGSVQDERGNLHNSKCMSSLANPAIYSSVCRFAEKLAITFSCVRPRPRPYERATQNNLHTCTAPFSPKGFEQLTRAGSTFYPAQNLHRLSMAPESLRFATDGPPVTACDVATDATGLDSNRARVGHYYYSRDMQPRRASLACPPARFWAGWALGCQAATKTRPEGSQLGWRMFRGDGAGGQPQPERTMGVQHRENCIGRESGNAHELRSLACAPTQGAA